MKPINLDAKEILATAPYALYQLIDKHVGDEDWPEWEPETLLSLFKKIGTDEGLDADIAKDKVLAVQAVATNPALPGHSAVAFEKVVTAFNNEHVVVGGIQPPEIEEITYAVKELKNFGVELSGEVPGYIAAVAVTSHWTVLPSLLSIAQPQVWLLLRKPEGSKLYQELQSEVEQYKQVLLELERSDMNIKDLSEDQLNSAPEVIKQLIGALAYDPTLLHR